MNLQKISARLLGSVTERAKRQELAGTKTVPIKVSKATRDATRRKYRNN